MSSGYRNCPYCGRLIASDAGYCRHCGADLGGGGNRQTNDIAEETNADRANGNFRFPEVLTYMFQDRNAAQKIGGLSLLVFLSLMLSFATSLGANKNAVVEMGVNFPYYIANAVVGLVLIGYNFTLVESLSSQNGNYKIPAINFAGNIGRGLTWVLAGIVFGLGIGIIVILGLFLTKLGAAVAAIGFLVSLILILCYLIFMPAYMWIFANRRYFTIFFRFSLAVRCIAYDFTRYMVAIGAFVIYFVFAWIFYTIFMITTRSLSLIAFALVMSVLYTYSTMVTAYITAKSLSSNCRQELY